MLFSENDRFGQGINADQRHLLFSAHYQLVLDRTKPENQYPSFGEKIKTTLPERVH
jgi:hypothetical protein